MKTFIFNQKNSSITVILTADNLEEAEESLTNTVKNTYGWRVQDPEGEIEDWYDEDDEDDASDMLYGVDNNQ